MPPGIGYGKGRRKRPTAQRLADLQKIIREPNPSEQLGRKRRYSDPGMAARKPSARYSSGNVQSLHGRRRKSKYEKADARASRAWEGYRGESDLERLKRIRPSGKVKLKKRKGFFRRTPRWRGRKRRK